MANLTFQQEAFAQAIVAGKKQIEAFREAYPNGAKWPLASQNSRASNLMRNRKIAARIAELKAPAIEAIQVSFEERIARYAELARLALEAKDISAAIRAEDSLTKVAGLFAAERPNDRSAVDGLTARQRDTVRATVQAALEKARADAGNDT